MFSENERLIYRYRDGETERCADPLAIRRRLREAQKAEGIDLAALSESYDAIRQAIASEAEAAKAEGRTPRPLPGSLIDEQYDLIDRMARLALHTFDVQPLRDDGSGWTQYEAVVALTGYLAWENQLQGEPEASPSLSTATAGRPADSAMAGPDPLTTGPSAA